MKKVNHIARVFGAAALALSMHYMPTASRADANTLSQPEYHRIAEWRYEALSGDRKHVPQMIAALHSETQLPYLITATYALARLGVTEALPDVQALTKTYGIDPPVLAARLQTEADLPAVASVRQSVLTAQPLTATMQQQADTRAQAKVQKFLAYLNMTPQQVSEGVVSFLQAQERPKEIRTDDVEVASQELEAMRQIADIVYREPGVTPNMQKALSNINFAVDFRSDLKMRLAPLSHRKRIAWLINDLAQKTILKGPENFEVQLAIDEGIDASNAAAAKLKEMDGKRDKFSSCGFVVLFDVLDGVGDKAHIPLIKHFVADKDGIIANSAGAHGGVAGGSRFQYVMAY